METVNLEELSPRSTTPARKSNGVNEAIRKTLLTSIPVSEGIRQTDLVKTVAELHPEISKTQIGARLNLILKSKKFAYLSKFQDESGKVYIGNQVPATEAEVE